MKDALELLKDEKDEIATLITRLERDPVNNKYKLDEVWGELRRIRKEISFIKAKDAFDREGKAQ